MFGAALKRLLVLLSNVTLLLWFNIGKDKPSVLITVSVKVNSRVNCALIVPRCGTVRLFSFHFSISRLSHIHSAPQNLNSLFTSSFLDPVITQAHREPHGWWVGDYTTPPARGLTELHLKLQHV